MSYKVIDVSVHDGSIDWKKVKEAGIDGVIIRAGYGKYTSQKDKLFEDNYSGAVAVGLHVGTYWYSYARNAEEALQEAKAFYTVIKGKKFDMPVFIDIEENCSKSYSDAIVTNFNGYMESKGYFAGIYANKNWFVNYISDYTASSYFAWVAQYNKECTWDGSYQMWQYTSDGTVDGILHRVDMNELYTPIWECITESGFNGYEKHTSDSESKSDDISRGVVTVSVSYQDKEIYHYEISLDEIR